MAMLFCEAIAGAIGVPAHNHASGYLAGTPYHMDNVILGSLTKKFGRKAMATDGPAVFIVGLVGAALASDS